MYAKKVPISLYSSKFQQIISFSERKANVEEIKNDTTANDLLTTEKETNAKYELVQNMMPQNVKPKIGGYGKKFSFGRVAGRH